MIKLICFDLDGVMSDTSWIHEGAFKEAVRNVSGYVITDEDEVVLHARSTKRKLELMVKAGLITAEQAEQIAAQKQEETEKLVRQFVVADVQKSGMLKALKKQGVKIACVSNCIRSTVELILRQMHCFQYFDYIVSNEDVSEPKPSPEGYIKAMQRFYMDGVETLIVEDSDVGCSAGYAANANVMRVPNPTHVTLQRLNETMRQLCKS